MVEEPLPLRRYRPSLRRKGRCGEEPKRSPEDPCDEPSMGIMLGGRRRLWPGACLQWAVDTNLRSADAAAHWGARRVWPAGRVVLDSPSRHINGRYGNGRTVAGVKS